MSISSEYLFNNIPNDIFIYEISKYLDSIELINLMQLSTVVLLRYYAS